MKFNTVRFKISILYTAILGCILIVYTSYLYYTLYYNMYGELDNKLKIKAHSVSNTVASYLSILGYEHRAFLFSFYNVILQDYPHPDQGKIRKLRSAWQDNYRDMGLTRDYIVFLNKMHKPVVYSHNVPLSLVDDIVRKDTARKSAAGVTLEDIFLKGKKLRVINLPFAIEGKEYFTLHIASSIDDMEVLIKTRFYHRLLAIPVIMLLGFFIGMMFADRILRPVSEITKAAKRITYEDLSARVKARHIDQEMQSLVDAFNEMIGRLENSFKYINEFSSQVAHELKTPLAIIRGQSEVVLRKERRPEEYKAILEINLEEVERMVELIDDLLLLTKLEYKPEIFRFERTNLCHMLEEIYRQTTVLASAKKISIELDVPDEKLFISADKLHLRRLFLNLINNALKSTPEGGLVKIIALREEKSITVRIEDNGIGIPAHDLTKIFNKFYRRGGASGSESGTGLGLSIVKSIARIHNAQVLVQSKLGEGSVFTVILQPA